MDGWMNEWIEDNYECINEMMHQLNHGWMEGLIEKLVHCLERKIMQDEYVIDKLNTQDKNEQPSHVQLVQTIPFDAENLI